jgi:hypothetical protein
MNEDADEFVYEEQLDDSVGLCDWMNHVMSLGS